MFAREEQAQAMRAAEAMAYVTKEIQIDKLIAVIRRCYAERWHLRKRPYR